MDINQYNFILLGSFFIELNLINRPSAFTRDKSSDSCTISLNINFYKFLWHSWKLLRSRRFAALRRRYIEIYRNPLVQFKACLRTHDNYYRQKINYFNRLYSFVKISCTNNLVIELKKYQNLVNFVVLIK